MKTIIIPLAVFIFSLLNLSYSQVTRDLGKGYKCYLKRNHIAYEKLGPEVMVYLYNIDLNDTHTRSWAKMIVDDYSWAPTRTVARGHTKLYPRLGGLEATVYGFQLQIGVYDKIVNGSDFPAVGRFYLDDSGELYGLCYWHDHLYREDL